MDSITPPPLFTVGDIVMVDDTNKAYIIDVRVKVMIYFLSYNL